MKDPADKVTTEMFSEEEKLKSAHYNQNNQKSVHSKPTSWEEAIDQVVDERRELLDMLKRVLASGWELGVCIEAQTLVRKLRAIDAACEAEFSGKGSNV